VDVRFGDGREPESFFRGHREVAIDVSFGVDEQGVTGALTADQVRELGQLFVHDLPK
jgi:hypothetical protein